MARGVYLPLLGFLRGESSGEIYAQADAQRMKECYLGFHTLDAAMAIEDLIEIHRQSGGLTDFREG